MLEPVSQSCNSTEEDGSSTVKHPTRTRRRPALHGLSACRGLANIMMAAQHASGRQTLRQPLPGATTSRDCQPGCCVRQVFLRVPSHPQITGVEPLQLCLVRGTSQCSVPHTSQARLHFGPSPGTTHVLHTYKGRLALASASLMDVVLVLTSQDWWSSSSAVGAYNRSACLNAQDKKRSDPPDSAEKLPSCA